MSIANGNELYLFVVEFRNKRVPLFATVVADAHVSRVRVILESRVAVVFGRVLELMQVGEWPITRAGVTIRANAPKE